jgi:hypothetical protein
VNGQGRTNGSKVDTVEPAAPVEEAAGGEVRPALSPAQLAFLALIAALILTAIRRLRQKPG